LNYMPIRSAGIILNDGEYNTSWAKTFFEPGSRIRSKPLWRRTLVLHQYREHLNSAGKSN